MKKPSFTHLSTCKSFVETYLVGNKEKTVFVTVIIDYVTQTLSVYPSVSNTDVVEFGFIKGGYEKLAMWKAILKAIDSAIDFGKAELEKEQLETAKKASKSTNLITKPTQCQTSKLP